MGRGYIRPFLMDESQSLEALATLLDSLSQNPYDISLHAQHIRLAEASGISENILSARQMFTACWAAGDEVWIPLLDEKLSSTDLGTFAGISEILELYDRAEQDYLSTQILRKHLQFIIDRCSYFASLETNPDDLGDAFSLGWTRAAVDEVVAKGAGHLTESHILWDIQRDWQLDVLESTPENERSTLVSHIESMFLDRLRQPHSNIDDTFQFYSTFTSTYKSPDEYESLLVAASKLRVPAVELYQRKDSREIALAQAHFSPEAYAYYINGERRSKKLEVFTLSTLYERAIAETAKRRFSGDLGAEAQLRVFWSGYCDTLRLCKVEYQTEMSVFRRALRSVPGSGEVWARYIRFLERSELEDEPMDGRESIPDAFAKALSTNLIQSDIEQIVPLTLAKAGVDKRNIDAGTADEDTFGSLISVLEEGIMMVRTASRDGDARFRLEKYLTQIYLSIDLPDSAIATWKAATKHTKTSYLAWISYSDVLIKQKKYDGARALFTDICNKKLDWPEAIWDAWIVFEHLYGSIQNVEECLDRVEKAQGFLHSRRVKEAEEAAYQTAKLNMEQHATNVPDIAVPQDEVAMEVDSRLPSDPGNKRKAVDDTAESASKKMKTESTPPPLKRDRENCTVFVSDLPDGTTPEELTALFKDCGSIRDIKITALLEVSVATVEFSQRESVPAALTKDKKRIRNTELSVHLAWKSTLYVTNFPASMDDLGIKKLFGKYGTVFDVRWPSKKFKNTRRFCYVQFTSPIAAEVALQLHGQELDEGLTLNVFISNPERKKERTDADANAKEIYVAGLSKFATKEDLEIVFKTYGPVKEVRMTLDNAGHSKGFAFVEFEREADAISALNANNYELKKRRIAVTLADTHVKPKRKNFLNDSGLGRLAEVQSRSVRIHKLPHGAQEGLLQQTLERYAAVKRVEIFEELHQATVELETAAEAGKLLLRTEPIVFEGTNLDISEEEAIGGTRKPGGSGTGAGGMFVPRKTIVPVPKAGLGSKKGGLRSGGALPTPGENDASGSRSQRGQDDFRKMLGGK